MSEKVDLIMDTIPQMTLLEVKELTDRMKEEFGIQALTPTMQVQTVTESVEAPVVEDKTEFTVTLESPGEMRVNVIKVVRELTGLGLKESKDLVDAAPAVVLTEVDRTAADRAEEKLKEVGATVKVT